MASYAQSSYRDFFFIYEKPVIMFQVHVEDRGDAYQFENKFLKLVSYVPRSSITETPMVVFNEDYPEDITEASLKP